MRGHYLKYSRFLGAVLAVPMLASFTFAPNDGSVANDGTEPAEKPAVVDTSIGPIPLPGNAVTPSVADSKGPIRIPGVEIKNFGVADGRIFRGEQPGRDDYAALARLGVKTIVDLRLDARPNSKELAEAAGLRYVNIPIDDHKQPTDADVKTFIDTVEAPDCGPVYVHCAGGRHRTGSMVALYRMIHDGWTVDQAYDEMLAYDFYTSNGHKGFKTYVFDYFARMKADPKSVPAAYVAPNPDGTVPAAAPAPK